jgi:HEAT repeat protein
MARRTNNKGLKNIVFGEIDESLVFIARKKALELAETWDALTSSITWGEFRSLVPSKRFDEVVDLCCDDAPSDDDPFPGLDIPAVSDGDYPEWPAKGMLKWVPQEVIESPYARIEDSVLNGRFLVLDTRGKDEILAAFRSAGFRCTEDQELVLRAAGHSPPKEVPRSIPDLIRRLTSTNWDARYNASCALVEIGETAIPALHEALRDKDEAVRSGAAHALGEIRPVSQATTIALHEALRDTNDAVRSSAASALGKIRPVSQATIIALAGLLKDSCGDVASSAGTALGDIGPEAKETVPALIEALKDKRHNVQQGAGWALGHIGKEAAAAIPALIGSLKDSALRWRATWALGKIGDRALAAVIEALKDGDAQTRRNAAHALGEIASHASEAIEALVKAQNEETDDLALEAITQAVARVHWLVDREGVK